MRTWLASAAFFSRRMAMKLPSVVALLTLNAAAAFAQPASEAGGEASLKLPRLDSVSFLNGAIDGHKLLLIGILFCLFGLGFGIFGAFVLLGAVALFFHLGRVWRESWSEESAIRAGLLPEAAVETVSSSAAV